MSAPVHLVTGDSAFYEGRNRNGGLAPSLAEEIRAANKDIRIYPAIRDFLTAMGSGALAIDVKVIGEAIVESVKGSAHEIATRDGHLELGSPHMPKIKGYATPKPSLIAISFEVVFDLNFVEKRIAADETNKAELSVKGVCSYEPNTGRVSEIEVREWSSYLKGPNEGWGRTSPDRLAMERQFSPSRMRIISGRD